MTFLTCRRYVAGDYFYVNKSKILAQRKPVCKLQSLSGRGKKTSQKSSDRVISRQISKQGIGSFFLRMPLDI